MKPIIKSGKFYAGSYFSCGENVVIDVEENVVVGDRVVLADNTYIGGRRVEIGDDFFNYQWEASHLDIGRGRRDEEDAILKVGNRNTWHNIRVDLARRVTIGDDVGLSPDVTIYNHGYWNSLIRGHPYARDPVTIGNSVIIGYRSVVLPGALVGDFSTIGAQSVVSGHLEPYGVYGGNPLRKLRQVELYKPNIQEMLLKQVLSEYQDSCTYRGWAFQYKFDFPSFQAYGCSFNVNTLKVEGDEDERSDDLREFAFKRGIRFYTQRPFQKLGKKPSTS